jgi:hypothetical protein
MPTFRPPEPVPRVAVVLGVAGVIPFVAAAIVLWVSETHRLMAVTGGIAFGAVVLSFLGGIRWGTAIGPFSPRRIAREFTFSVLPAIAGWFALLIPFLPALCLLIAGFLLQALWDVVSVENGKLPGWFGKLRMMLTIIAVASLLAMTARLVI